MGSGNGTADFDFETNLRVANYKQGYTLQADNMYLSELNLFGYKFPACSGETMSWQKLKLKNKDEVYLVCGEAEKSTSCEPPAGEPTEQACPAPSTAKQTRTWNYTTCKWNAWQGDCSLKKCLTKATSCFQGTHTGEGSYGNTGRHCPLQKGDALVSKTAPSAIISELKTLTNRGYISKPSSCTPGTECEDCIVGKTYYDQYDLWSSACGNTMFFSLPIYQCSQLADCSTGTGSNCRVWNSGVGGLVDPSGQL